MGRPLLPLSTEKLEALGFTKSISSFFTAPPKPPPKPGRPPGTTKARPGPKPAQQAPAQGSPTAMPAAAAPTPKAPAAPVAATAKTSGGGKGTRVNYSIGKPLQQLTTAVDDWLNKKGTFLAEESMTLARFCAIVDIPMPTFKKYVCKDEAKRQMVGCGVGGQQGTGTLLLPDTEQFVVDVLRRRDRANDGMGRRGAIQLVQDLQLELTAQQAATSSTATSAPSTRRC